MSADKPQVIFLLGGPGSGIISMIHPFINRQGNCLWNSPKGTWLDSY